MWRYLAKYLDIFGKVSGHTSKPHSVYLEAVLFDSRRKMGILDLSTILTIAPHSPYCHDEDYTQECRNLVRYAMEVPPTHEDGASAFDEDGKAK